MRIMCPSQLTEILGAFDKIRKKVIIKSISIVTLSAILAYFFVED